MVDKGAVDDADFLFGVHLRPIEELPLKQVVPRLFVTEQSRIF